MPFVDPPSRSSRRCALRRARQRDGRARDAPVFDPAHNWVKILSDDRMWGAIGHTYLYTIVAIAIELLLGLLIALLLDTDRKGYGVLRALMTLPLVVPPPHANTNPAAPTAPILVMQRKRLRTVSA